MLVYLGEVAGVKTFEDEAKLKAKLAKHGVFMVSLRYLFSFGPATITIPSILSLGSFLLSPFTRSSHTTFRSFSSFRACLSELTLKIEHRLIISHVSTRLGATHIRAAGEKPAGELKPLA